MKVTGLREIGVGVKSLDQAAKIYVDGLGMEGLGRGELELEAADALWGLAESFEVMRVGRPALRGAPGIRLVECSRDPEAANWARCRLSDLSEWAIRPLGWAMSSIGCKGSASSSGSHDNP